jgi:hypothetical protein
MLVILYTLLKKGKEVAKPVLNKFFKVLHYSLNSYGKIVVKNSVRVNDISQRLWSKLNYSLL